MAICKYCGEEQMGIYHECPHKNKDEDWKEHEYTMIGNDYHYWKKEFGKFKSAIITPNDGEFELEFTDETTTRYEIRMRYIEYFNSFEEAKELADAISRAIEPLSNFSYKRKFDLSGWKHQVTNDGEYTFERWAILFDKSIWGGVVHDCFGEKYRPSFSYDKDGIRIHINAKKKYKILETAKTSAHHMKMMAETIVEGIKGGK